MVVKSVRGLVKVFVATLNQFLRPYLLDSHTNFGEGTRVNKLAWPRILLPTLGRTEKERCFLSGFNSARLAVLPRKPRH